MSSLIVEVCEISSLEAHPNADKLDIATVKGWNCIVGKGQYSVGDLCVFFPPDSVLPVGLVEKYELDFLKKGGRVGVLKLRGFVSQGLVLSIDCLGDGKFKVGDDVAKHLGVTKYEVPEIITSKSGNIASRKVQNSNFSKYTDIENIRNFSNVFVSGDIVQVTEKIHGSNIRFGWLPIQINYKNGNILSILRSLWNKYVRNQSHEFVYGSHNVQLQFDNSKNYYATNIYADILKSVDVDSLPPGYIIYGEVFGKGVQDLEYGLSGKSLVIFDVKDITTGKYLDVDALQDFCREFSLPQVPVLFVGEFSDTILENYTSGKSVICSSQIKEGCVIKSYYESNDNKIGRKILKSISPEYLTRKSGTEYK